jgi:iron complex transport system substrate-binding protein
MLKMWPACGCRGWSRLAIDIFPALVHQVNTGKTLRRWPRKLQSRIASISVEGRLFLLTCAFFTCTNNWRYGNSMRPKFAKTIAFWFSVAIVSFILPHPAAAKTVVDQMGRRLTVPDSPKRVVALAPSITEIIFTLKQEQCLKGVTIYSNYPPQALALPKVGTYTRLDLERIMALDPDLCIAIKDGNPKGAVDRLTELNIPVYTVNPIDIQTVATAVMEIGGLLNADQTARRLVDEMLGRIERVRSRIANNTRRPRVFFQIGVAPIVSIGKGTFISELIELAGGQNVAAGTATYPRFNREQVLALDPEVIIISSMARGASFEQVKAEWGRWPELPAVRNHRIHIVESDLFDRPTPRLADALEMLAKLVHPEIFGNSP